MAGDAGRKGHSVSRQPVLVRDATDQDAGELLALWTAAAGGEGESPHPVAGGGPGAAPGRVEASAALARMTVGPDQRVLVAVLGDQVAGAVHVTLAQLSPVQSATAAYVWHLQVAEPFRRRGVGHALVEATLGWAEGRDASHVVVAASVTSRDANRFMARLGLSQLAVIRGSTTAALRAKLPVGPPAAARVDGRSHRSVGQVLVRRRSMRRAATRPS